MIVIALVVTTAELALVAVLGSWQRWLVIHAAIAVIFLVVFLAKFGQRGRARRAGTTSNGTGRGLGGLFGGRSTGATASGHRTGGLGGSRGRGLGRLFGGRGAGGHGGGGTHGRGMSGRLGGLLRRHGPGRGHGTGAHGTGAHGTGRAPGRGVGGLFRGRGNGAGTGGHGNGGHGRSGRGSGLGGMFGGKGTGHGGGHGGGRSDRGNSTRWSPFGGGTGHNDKDHHGRGKSGNKGKGKDSAVLRQFFARTADEFKKGWEAGGRKKPKDDEDLAVDPSEQLGPPGDRKCIDDPDDRDPRDDIDDIDDPDDLDDPDARDDTRKKATGNATPGTPAATPRGGKTMVKTHGNPSLQAWGRCLPTVEETLLEKQREFKRLEVEMQAVLTAIDTLHNQGEHELPESPRLISALEDIKKSVERLPKVSEALARIAGNATALGPLYRTEFAGDENRLAGERGGVNREKRADVGEAQKDT